jgi:hypothetical protein
LPARWTQSFNGAVAQTQRLRDERACAGVEAGRRSAQAPRCGKR